VTRDQTGGGIAHQEDLLMTIQSVDVLYTAVATAENGRDGRVASDDGKLDVIVNPPKELGGSGAGTNPEQLFAAGYSACFQSALGVVARQAKADLTDSRVTAKVGLGKTPAGGFGLTVELAVSIPHVDDATAKTLAEKAHEVCPYSNATRGNITVDLTIV
jgi:lipoyl-dependent peroxiredoxin